MRISLMILITRVILPARAVFASVAALLPVPDEALSIKVQTQSMSLTIDIVATRSSQKKKVPK
jgi:hypothetical protein